MEETQGVMQASQHEGILFQEETYLSQHAATQQSVDEDSIEEEGHYDPTATHNDDSDINSNEAHEKSRWRKDKANIFNHFSSDYNLICKTGWTSFLAFREIERALPELLRDCQILSRQEEEARIGVPVDTSMGLPTDRSTSNWRIHPVYSPPRSRRMKPRKGYGPNTTHKGSYEE